MKSLAKQAEGLGKTMELNKIVLGNSNVNSKRQDEPVLNDIIINAQAMEQKAVQEQKPLNENLWGNDQKILKMLDDDQRAERRFYTRALYMQKIVCNFLMDDFKSEPVLLKNPLSFMVIDISMGGIGVVCEQELEPGTVLSFKLTMDNISYDVKYKVVYCFPNEGKFRAGLKLAYQDKQFIKHLKILVARLSLQSMYGNSVS